MRKRSVAIAVLCAALFVALAGVAGCGSSQEGQDAGTDAREAYVGTWGLLKVTFDGEAISRDKLAKQGVDGTEEIVLAGDGSAAVTMLFGSHEGTWEMSGNGSMSIALDGVSLNGSLEEGNLALVDKGGNFFGEELTFVFKRTGDAPDHAEAADSEEGEENGVDTGTLSVSDFAVKDLKMEGTPEEGFTVTGTLVNNGSKDAGRVLFDLVVTEHETDDYGDDVTTEATENPMSITPGVIDGAFYNMKAGEERPFTLMFASFASCTDPTVTITEVLPGADSNNSSVLFGYDEFDVALSYDRGFEQCNASITNKLDVPISNCTLHYAYIAKYGADPDNTEGTWEKNEYPATKSFGTGLGERIWPGKTFECNPSANNVPRENFVFLGMTYEIDEEAAASNVWDEFAIDVDEDAQVVKITNNTGHYLENVYLDGAATDSSGHRNGVVWSAEHVAPGKTVEMQVISSLSGYYDINIFDIGYEIDEEKEGQVTN